MCSASSSSDDDHGLSLLVKVASRYAPSRMLSFNVAHVIMALQLMGRYGRVSRSRMKRELMLGEGSVKTLLKHMRMHGMVETTRSGSALSSKGKELYEYLSRVMVAEAEVPECSLAVGRFNYAVRVKGMAGAVRSGVEQRDAAIRVGALGATTLVYTNSRFVMPGSRYGIHIREKDVIDILKGLMPEEGDVIIIGSASSTKVAEMAAKYATVTTILNIHG
ncbi:MAG: DUF4443 domain-containing protein [Candidatus Nitrosocaldus sp.]|nr:DUF4443 domain-containing protein [Candidatus Nitrosocaldus sp.]